VTLSSVLDVLDWEFSLLIDI